MEPLKSPTIHDVAKQAGVSLSTVSRVMNDPDLVSPQTREKVEAAIATVGYEKTRTENDKQSEETRLVGLIVPDIVNPFFPLLIKGIEHVSKIHDYSLILCDSENDETLEEQHINTLCDRGVDGIILIPSSGATHVEKLVKKGFPFVFLDRFIEMEGASNVTCDNEEGAYQGVKYLLKLGHQQMVILTGPKDLSTEQARLKGVQRALGEEGITCHDELCVCANYNLEDAYQAMLKILAAKTPITAIFALNDMMAFGAKKALEEQGFRVPEDVSLVGYDDILFSAIISLTSVAQPTYEMGKNAMMLLLDLIHGRITTPQHIVLRPSMVIRGSCKRR
jgi:DNA-binding LacI/PurR family transcriptional regulator